MGITYKTTITTNTRWKIWKGAGTALPISTIMSMRFIAMMWMEPMNLLNGYGFQRYDNNTLGLTNHATIIFRWVDEGTFCTCPSTWIIAQKHTQYYSISHSSFFFFYVVDKLIDWLIDIMQLPGVLIFTTSLVSRANTRLPPDLLLSRASERVNGEDAVLLILVVTPLFQLLCAW